jgi:hypothetical protein
MEAVTVRERLREPANRYQLTEPRRSRSGVRSCRPLRDRRGSVTFVSVLEFFTASYLDFIQSLSIASRLHQAGE